MTNKLRITSYLSTSVSRQIAELYASTAIADLGLSMVLLFEPIYLYSVIGLSVISVLWFFAAVYFFYLLVIPLGARIVSKYGYEHGIFFSIPFQIIYWFLLIYSKDVPQLLYFAPLVFAIEKSLFWPAFHASVTRFARDGQRGREFSILYAIVNIAHIAGPFAGGLLAQKFGLNYALWAAAIVYFFSFVPLFTTREVFVPKLYNYKDTWQIFKQFPEKFLGYMGFGEELLVLTIWPIYIFIVVHNYAETGLLATGATLVATILALYIGKITDSFSERLLIKVGAFFSCLVYAARFLATNFMSTLAIDTLSRTSKDLVFIPVSTVTYKRADETHIMPYVVFFEQSLSVGKLLACILGIVIFSATGSFFALFILAALFSLLYMFL